MPTVKFADGSTLTNPSIKQVKAKLVACTAAITDVRRPQRQSSAAQDSMISLAIEIDPGSSSRDGESLLQSPSLERLADLGAGEPRRLGDLAVVERELLLGIADGVEADHQRPRERPRLAAQVLARR